MEGYKIGDHNLIHDRMQGKTVHEDMHHKNIHSDMNFGHISNNKSTFGHDSKKK